MYDRSTIAAVSALVGVWMYAKTEHKLCDGQRDTPGRVARNLRKQGMPFTIAHALIFKAAPRFDEHTNSTVDVPVGSGPTTLDITL